MTYRGQALAHDPWAGLRRYLVANGWRIDSEITWEETWTKAGCGVFMVPADAAVSYIRHTRARDHAAAADAFDRLRSLGIEPDEAK